MEAQGLIGRVDAEGMELDALSSENSYEEAVDKGILSLDQIKPKGLTKDRRKRGCKKLF